jgi:hypothetical protein
MAKGVKTGGRVAGTPNKTTASMKAAIESVYRDLQADHAKESGDTRENSHFLTWARDNETEFYKLASKLLPVQLTGANGGPIQTEVTTKEQRDAAVAAAMNADR